MQGGLAGSSTRGRRCDSQCVAVAGGTYHEGFLVIAVSIFPVLRVHLWRVAVATVGHPSEGSTCAGTVFARFAFPCLDVHHPNLSCARLFLAACRQWLCRVRTDALPPSARTVGVATALSLVHRTMRHSLG